MMFFETEECITLEHTRVPRILRSAWTCESVY
jgi:hypothetical protein